MKKFFKLFLLLSIASTLFYSCKKNENSTPELNENAYYVDGKKIFDINYASLDFDEAGPGTTFILSRKPTGSEKPYDNNEYIFIEVPQEIIGKKTNLYTYNEEHRWSPWIMLNSTLSSINFDVFLGEGDIEEHIEKGEISEND